MAQESEVVAFCIDGYRPRIDIHVSGAHRLASAGLRIALGEPAVHSWYPGL